MKHVARFMITPELLAQALCLPDGTAIVSARMDESGHGFYVVLTVQHDDLRLAYDSAYPPVVRPRFQRDEATLRPAVTFVSWGQELDLDRS